MLLRRCVKVLAYQDFNSININWEYPRYADHSGTLADTKNFMLLLTARRVTLEGHMRETGKVYGLTAVLQCMPNNIVNIKVDKLTHLLLEFNLMSYNFPTRRGMGSLAQTPCSTTTGMATRSSASTGA